MEWFAYPRRDEWTYTYRYAINRHGKHLAGIRGESGGWRVTSWAFNWRDPRYFGHIMYCPLAEAKAFVEVTLRLTLTKED